MIKKLDSSNVGEYKQLRLLALQTDPDSYFSTYEEAVRLPDYSFEADLRSQANNFGYYGYFRDGKLVGYISLQLPYFQKQAHIGEIYNLFVHPDFRNGGIAHQLLQTVIEVAKNSPQTEVIFLSVMSENLVAIQLYKQAGFVAYAEKKKSLKVGDRYIDETLMRLDVQ